jgi:histidine ammonia-lyase
MLPIKPSLNKYKQQNNTDISSFNGKTPSSLTLSIHHSQDCISCVPAQGSVGASGDLAPLAHLALGLMGEGKMWGVPNPNNSADHIFCDEDPSCIKDAAEVLREAGLDPIDLEAKEGLAMINGTQFISALTAEALYRARIAAETADVVCALTLEALQGTVNAYRACIHSTRPHRGQGLVAMRMRALLHSTGNESEIYTSHTNCGRVQDAYSLRCAPQVHGLVHDTLDFVESIVEVEINSATDNPMVFASDTEGAEEEVARLRDQRRWED